MLLSLGQRIHYWITQFKDFRYPATPALPSKPGTAPAAWHYKNNGSPGGQAGGATPIVIVRYQ